MEGTKHDATKLRLDLIPPTGIFAEADVFTKGAAKYGDRNWEDGILFSRVFGALLRHAYDWWAGEELDPDDNQHHLASVAWCAHVLLTYMARHQHQLDDRPLLSDVTSRNFMENLKEYEQWRYDAVTRLLMDRLLKLSKPPTTNAPK